MRSQGCLAAALLALAATALAGPRVAAAQSTVAEGCEPRNGFSPCIDAQGLWVHPGPGRFVALGPASTTPSAQAAFGILVSYMSRPIGLRIASADPDGLITWLVDDAIDATYWAALGITDRLELSIAAPVTFFQSGAGLGAVLGSGEQLSRTAVRDPRLGVAYAVVPRDRAGDDDGPSLVARGEMALPVGDEDGFARATTVTFAPSVAAEWRLSPLTLGAELIGRIRGESQFADAVWGTQVGGGLGATVLVWPEARMRVGAEAFTLVDVDSQPSGDPLMPAEWILHVDSAPLLGGDVSFLAGGGGPIPWTGEAPVGTPRVRFELGVRYAPEGRDTDADGVLDRDDGCPGALEDTDGFQDADGCPDADNDGDRVPDVRDRCRDQPETVDGFADEDGCPDPDDDRDGVPDAEDRCRAVAEDRDGVADEDGCPEDDDDDDGVLDAKDLCPRGAEDKDGFRDDDGCPDPDNDGDGTPDATDRCPGAAEDRDGFSDEDGCPDPDDDVDGVGDALDRCPREAETIDGQADDDGCPEPGATTRPRWAGSRVEIERLARFPRGSDAPPAQLEAQLRMMAQLARSRAALQVVIVEAWADRSSDASPRALDLAAKRADAARRVLAAAGIPLDRITAAAGDPAQKRAADAPQLEITVQQGGDGDAGGLK